MKNLIYVYTLLCCIVFSVQAQQDSTALQELITLATKHNLLLQNYQLAIEKSQVKEKSSLILPKTAISLQYGNINSNYPSDVVVQVVQNFAPIGSVSANKKAYQAETQTAQTALAYQKNALQFQLSQLYWQFVFLKEKQIFLTRQDSLWQEIERLSKVRLEAGETDKLTLLTAQNQRLQLRQQSSFVKNTYQSILHQLRQHTQSDLQEWEKKAQKAALKAISVDNLPNLGTQHSSSIAFYEAKHEMALKQIQVLKSQAMPEIQVGYWSPSFEGEVGVYNVIQVGMAVPLLWKGYRSKIEQSKLEALQTQNEVAFQKNARQEELHALQKELQELQQLLQIYQNEQLIQVEELLQLTKTQYEEGEISVLELLQVQEQVYQTRLAYLEIVHAFNQAASKWIFLQN